MFIQNIFTPKARVELGKLLAKHTNMRLQDGRWVTEPPQDPAPNDWEAYQMLITTFGQALERKGSDLSSSILSLFREPVPD